MQSFLDAHFTPVDGKFVKTHTDSALARIVGDFEGKKNALIPELTSVKRVLAELAAASGFLPLRVCLLPGVGEGASSVRIV